LKTVVDSYAWVEIFKASSEGRAAKKQIEEADEAFTPDVVLAELAAKYLREGEGQDSIRGWLHAIAEATQVLEIGIPIAEESAKASLELTRRARAAGLAKPGLADAIVLATARTNHAKVLTGDPHFKGLPDTIWLGG
jgi:predicted nucleic acid-binding protein